MTGNQYAWRQLSDVVGTLIQSIEIQSIKSGPPPTTRQSKTKGKAATRR